MITDNDPEKCPAISLTSQKSSLDPTLQHGTAPFLLANGVALTKGLAQKDLTKKEFAPQNLGLS